MTTEPVFERLWHDSRPDRRPEETGDAAASALREAGHHAGDDPGRRQRAVPPAVRFAAASVIFRRDFRDLPAFRETARARGRNALHLRVPAGADRPARHRRHHEGGQP
jgi:hypothetical protein